MRLFNTFGRKLEDFKPHTDGKIKLYTCGPTVYDTTQIGNLRTFVFYDTIRRLFEAANYTVDHVMNITDVGHLTSDADEGEDKLQKGAEREGKTVWEVADHYIELFYADAAALNLLPPKYARATDFIEPQLKMISLLIEKGFAYQTEQAIYFDVTKLEDYGKLTGQKLDEKEVAARAEVHTDTSKRSPQDFALWFFAVGRYKNHEMKWSSPWGEGFPGWHLECSAIAHELLGEPLDIHAGGVDLIGTHHTNEIAQTEAAFGKKLASYWLHGEHLLVNGKKMSKSDGNYVTLADIQQRDFEPLALRLLFLQSHYRSQVNFTWEALEAAQNFLKSLRAYAALVYQPAENHGHASIDLSQAELVEIIGNDLDTPAALAKVATSLSPLNGQLLSPEGAKKLAQLIKDVDELLGLELSATPDIDDSQKKLILEREAARGKNDWTASDEIRNTLRKQSIEIEDSPHGPLWRWI